ncbi:hypothetical protein, partial [Burkholderia multivorans]|uniref:hypothetical protein n=1 Tax=Burkholderia multivorans TaxID=87883 RepID=UPI001C660172
MPRSGSPRIVRGNRFSHRKPRTLDTASASVETPFRFLCHRPGVRYRPPSKPVQTSDDCVEVVAM